MIRLVYPTDPNFGDAMSPLIVEKLSGQKVRPSNMWNADMMAVGSVFYRGDYLMADTYHANLKRRLKAAAWDMCRYVSRPIYVWGSGFLQYPPFKQPHVIRKIKVLALRGKYTRRILEKYGLMGTSEKVVYGDPGLLFGDLFGICANPKHDVGIIPHVHDAAMGWRTKLSTAFDQCGIDAKFINASDKPHKVVSEIAECSKIISSSLHGLIVADSLGIPNLHVGLSTLGHTKYDFELKFHDYYSAYGEEISKIVSGTDLLAAPLRYIKDETCYHICSGNVKEIKDALRMAFPAQYKCSE